MLATLKTYLIIYSGGKLHKCAQCGKPFTLVDTLKIMWLFTLTRFHKYAQCSQYFTDFDSHKTHMLIHVGLHRHPMLHTVKMKAEGDDTVWTSVAVFLTRILVILCVRILPQLFLKHYDIVASDAPNILHLHLSHELGLNWLLANNNYICSITSRNWFI